MTQANILIVDDDHDMVETVKAVLEASGCKVSLAYDGLQGLVQAHHSKPDIIFLDFNMPAGGGASLYERLRNSNDTRRIPVIFTTAVRPEEVMGHIHPGPRTYFLKKPVSSKQIQDMLEKVLAGMDHGSDASPVKGSKDEPPAARRHEYRVRVTYADTDKMGIIYYANYFKYFELGRTELLRSLGVTYRDLEVERKLFLPVIEANCEYLGPSRYDDLLVVQTWLSKLGRASVTLAYQIFDRGSVDRLVAKGFTRHAVVNERWQPSKIPPDLRSLLSPFVGK